MAARISVLGSTGSIGRQTLEVARELGLHVAGLAAGSNIDLLEKQVHEFKPAAVAVRDENRSQELKARLNGYNVDVYQGVDGLCTIASLEGIDTVVNAIVGIAGLIPTLTAIKNGIDIALANKETLVTAGSVIMSEAARNNVTIIPVDSEHSAIFQCLKGNIGNDVSRIILTASGGPFRGRSGKELENVSPGEALNHPNWKMGSKITIDCATLMNKGLEIIEARWLFGLEQEKIQVLVHPESVIHSMVEYRDGSIIAQMGPPDMRIPIQYAMTYPERAFNSFSRLDLLKVRKLTFEEPDCDAFPCLALAREALKAGGTMPVVLNSSNETAVSLFMAGKTGFTGIPQIIEKVMERHIVNINPELGDIIRADAWARETAFKVSGGIV